MKGAERYSICCYNGQGREIGNWSSCKEADMQIRWAWPGRHAWPKSHIMKHKVYELHKEDSGKEGLPTAVMLSGSGGISVRMTEDEWILNAGYKNNNDSSLYLRAVWLCEETKPVPYHSSYQVICPWQRQEVWLCYAKYVCLAHFPKQNTWIKAGNSGILTSW